MVAMVEEAVAVTGEIVPAMLTLVEAEAVIERGMKTYLEMGRAMKAIQDGELYKEAGYPDFVSYCTGRWGYRQAQVYNLIAGAEVVDTLSTNVETPAPANEGQARELHRLIKQPEQMAEGWAEANEKADAQGKKVTAAMVKRAAQKRLPAPPKPKTRRGISLKTAMKDQNKIKSDFCMAWNLASPELKSWIFDFVHSNIVV